MFFPGNLLDIWDVFFGSGKIHDIVQPYHVIASRNDGFISTLDGYDMERDVARTQFEKRNVQNLCCFLHLGSDEYQRSSVKFPPLVNPTHFDCIHDVLGCQHFRVNQGMYTELGEKLLVLGQKILIIVDSCYGFLGTQIGCNHAGRHVAAFLGGNCNEQVGVAYSGILQCSDGCGRSANGHQVEVGIHSAEFVLVFVHQDNVLLFIRQ